MLEILTIFSKRGNMKLGIVFTILILTTNSWGKSQIPEVTLTELKPTNIKNSLYYPVQIKSQMESKVTADENYIVIKRLVQLGQTVKKGTPLLVLRNQDLTVEYKNRILRSPVSGVVASIEVEAGNFVKMGSSLIHINDPKNLIGKIEVAAVDFKKVKPGLKGKIDITSLGLKNIPIEVKGIGAMVSSLTGTITAEITFLGDISNLIPGVIGKAEITLQEEELNLVNEKSLYYIGDKTFLATVKGDEVLKKEVELGRRIKDEIQISKGLKPGEKYISDSPKFLRDGEKVKIKEKQENKKS